MATPAFAIVSVGEILFDFVAAEAADLESAAEFTRAPGGAPANVAVAVARLGSQAAFVGTVGDDAFGHALVDVLRGYGVDTTGVQIVPEQTTLAFVARNAGGIPDFVFYRGADAELRPEDVPVALIAGTSFVYASSMALMTAPSRDATMYAVELAREAGALVAVDPNLRPSRWPSPEAMRDAVLPLIGSADVLKLNDEEARVLTGKRDLEEAMEDLSDEGTLVTLTLGAAGCLWRLGDDAGAIESPPVTVRDSTGAGDAFMGALLAQLATQAFSPSPAGNLDIANLEAALRFACAAGAVSCTRLGAMPSVPTRQQVEDLLSQNRT